MPPWRPKRGCQEPQLAGIGAGAYWMHRGLVYLGRARCFGGRLAVVSGYAAVPSYFCVFRIQQHNLPTVAGRPPSGSRGYNAPMPPTQAPKPQASSGLHCVRCVRRSAGDGNATTPRRALTQPLLAAHLIQARPLWLPYCHRHPLSTAHLTLSTMRNPQPTTTGAGVPT